LCLTVYQYRLSTFMFACCIPLLLPLLVDPATNITQSSRIAHFTNLKLNTYLPGRIHYILVLYWTVQLKTHDDVLTLTVRCKFKLKFIIFLIYGYHFVFSTVTCDILLKWWSLLYLCWWENTLVSHVTTEFGRRCKHDILIHK
jgi:hypothetical protein